jgi:hypothetical protein
MEIDRDTEIDLWEVLSRGWIFFKRQVSIILTFFTIGLIYSISNFFTHSLEYKSFYRQEVIAESPITTVEILSEIINAIQPNVKNEATKYFPEFRKMKGKLEANKNKENRLKIYIEIFDSTKINTLLNALDSHIRSIAVLKNKFDFRNQQLKQLSTALAKKLNEPNVDATKSNNIELLEKKQSIEEQLVSNKIIEFIPITNQPIFENNFRASVLNILGYSFLGLILGAIVAWLFELVSIKK